MAQAFKVSKVPVREALKHLEAEGFVVFHKNRGAVVTPLSLQDIAQLFQTRAILEAGALRASVPQLTPAMISEAERLEAAFAAEGDAARWSAMNWAFHAALYAGCANPFLLDLIRSVNDRIERYIRIHLSLTKGQAQADQEHLALIAACRAGQADQAAGLMHQHVMEACHTLLDHLRPQLERA